MARRKTRIRLLYVEKSMIWFELPGFGRFFAYPLPGSDFSDLCSCDSSDFFQYVDAELFIKFSYENSYNWFCIDRPDRWITNKEWYYPIHQDAWNYCQDKHCPIETGVSGKIKIEEEYDYDTCIIENEVVSVEISVASDTIYSQKGEDLDYLMIEDGVDVCCVGYLYIAIAKIDSHRNKESVSLEIAANKFTKVKVDCFDEFEIFDTEYGIEESPDRMYLYSPFRDELMVLVSWTSNLCPYDLKNKMNENREVGIKISFESCEDIQRISWYEFIGYVGVEEYRCDPIKVGVLKIENGKFYLEGIFGTCSVSVYGDRTVQWIETMVDNLVYLNNDFCLRVECEKVNLY